MSNNSTTTEASFIYTTSIEANRIKFIILLPLEILSVCCFLYVFYEFSRKHQLHGSLHHHAVILLLIVSFLFVTIELPITLSYMFTSYVYPPTDTFCSLWTWLHYSLNIINLFLMAFTSIERNWLVFHPSIVKTQKGKIIFHYCPLVFCLVYPPLFYCGVIFIYQCEFYYDYNQFLCKWPCYFYNLNLSNIDSYFNNYTPLFSIPVFCSIIYLRVLFQKRKMKQEAFKWNRDKKLILQLWAISSLYLAMWMPLQLTAFINLYWNPTFLLQAQIDYMFLFPYFIHLIYPFIVLLIFHFEKSNKSNPNTTSNLS